MRAQIVEWEMRLKIDYEIRDAATGARLALSVARQLQRSGQRYAVISLCIGVGQGLAVVLENVEAGK